jgi:hypothetical protein
MRGLFDNYRVAWFEYTPLKGDRRWDCYCRSFESLEDAKKHYDSLSHCHNKTLYKTEGKQIIEEEND